MGKSVKVRLGKNVMKYDEAALAALPRKKQIEVAIAMGIKLHRGVSKTGLVRLILAK
jgi:hypothetical protein